MILFLSQEMMIIGWVNSKSTESKSKACGLLLNEMIKNFEVDRKKRCAFFSLSYFEFRERSFVGCFSPVCVISSLEIAASLERGCSMEEISSYTAFSLKPDLLLGLPKASP